MNYYPHHIGDFRSGTVFMSRAERWLYRDMIEFYYDREQALPLDIDLLCRAIGVRTPDERDIVADLLRHNFERTETGFKHNRCEKEIAAYRAKGETARANGKSGGRPQKTKTNPEKPSGFQSGSYQVAAGNPEQTESKANQEPITNNQTNPPNPPGGGLEPVVKKTPAIALQTFIEACKQNGERPLRDYAPLWAYTKAAGLDDDFIALAWGEFCRRFMPGGAQPEKRQKDWRITFRKYVEGNYFKLWAIDKDGKYFLTSLGKQASKFHECKAAT